MKPTLVATRLITGAEKATNTRLEVIEVTEAVLAGWLSPPKQRTLVPKGASFLAAVEYIKETGVLPGVITIAAVGGKTYLLDGQHRVEAFRVTGLASVYADVRICHFNTWADAEMEWLRLNQHIRTPKPDDKLRCIEGSSPALVHIAKACPFIGYGNIRRSPDAPIVSMSVVLRAWRASVPEVPSSAGLSVSEVAMTMSEHDGAECATALNLMMEAWGRDREFWRLWGSLNLTLCLWIYRRTVKSAYSVKSTRFTVDEFRSGMQALSADDRYLTFLAGRQLTDFSRSPTYDRIRETFRRMFTAEGRKLYFPSPSWAFHDGTKRKGSQA